MGRYRWRQEFWTKHGEKLSLKFIVASGANEIAAVELQRQLNSFGFDVQIETMEYNKLRECYNNKDYDIGISNYWWSEPAYHLWMIVYDQNNELIWKNTGQCVLK